MLWVEWWLWGIGVVVFRVVVGDEVLVVASYDIG